MSFITLLQVKVAPIQCGKVWSIKLYMDVNILLEDLNRIVNEEIRSLGSYVVVILINAEIN
jgi:hypothetical protein